MAAGREGAAVVQVRTADRERVAAGVAAALGDAAGAASAGELTGETVVAGLGPRVMPLPPAPAQPPRHRAAPAQAVSILPSQFRAKSGLAFPCPAASEFVASL